jgi:hypothetical protein
MDQSAEDLRHELEQLSTEELISILRNRDESEWRAEALDAVPTILATRGVSPSEVAALGPEGYDVVEGQPLRTVRRYFSVVEAHAARLALEQAAIPAWVIDETLGSMFGFGIGARLRVRAGDEAAAREVLASGPTPASALPPELAEPPCPSCGSGAVTQSAEVVDEPPELVPEGPRRVWRYRCTACGHAWPAESGSPESLQS